MRNPAEGTILTVAREMAQRIAAENERDPEGVRLHPEAAPETQDRAIAVALERAVAAGEASVKRGPELLAALREAGVVDAGGYGLVVIFAGVVAALRGDDPPPLRPPRPRAHPSPRAQLLDLSATAPTSRSPAVTWRRSGSWSRWRRSGTRCSWWATPPR